MWIMREKKQYWNAAKRFYKKNSDIMDNIEFKLFFIFFENNYFKKRNISIKMVNSYIPMEERMEMVNARYVGNLGVFFDSNNDQYQKVFEKLAINLRRLIKILKQ